MKRLGFFLTFLMALQASAGLGGELNLFYNTDQFTAATNTSTSKMLYGLDVYANLETKRRYFAGFHVDQVSMQDTIGNSTVTLSSTNMGPMFLWVIDRKKLFNLAVGYNFVARGTSNNGTTDEALTGTGLFATFGAMPEVTDNFFVGIKLNYYSLNYSVSTVNSTASDVSYSRVLIYPSISFAWRN